MNEAHLQRAFYSLLALLALALIGWGLSVGAGPGAAFGLFAFFTIGGSLVCVWERSIVRSAFSLVGTFGGVAGLFLLLGADFLAVAQILIYVGGILALLLFGVMLTPPDPRERKLPRVLGGLAAMGLAVGWVAFKVSSTVKWAVADELPPLRSRPDEIGAAFLSAEHYVVPFELAAVVLTVAFVAAVYIARRRRADLVTEPDAGLEGGF